MENLFILQRHFKILQKQTSYKMKNFLLFFFTVILFISTNKLSAQENQNYLKVIAKSLPTEYIKSNANLFFTIQVGAFRNKNATLEKLDNIITTEEDKITKYRIGEFSTYREATDYKQMILSVCNDAFIVSIRDGKRIHIKEALKKAAIF